jgi:ketosteroid isomerase-like protein
MTTLDEIAIRLEAAFNAGDAAALASLYSETAILMPPNEPMVSGRVDIQAWFERTLSQPRIVRVIAIESKIDGDQAFQIGTFTSAVTTDAASSTPQGESSPNKAKYVLILRNLDGDWKIQYDIWNLDGSIAVDEDRQ